MSGGPEVPVMVRSAALGSWFHILHYFGLYLYDDFTCANKAVQDPQAGCSPFKPPSRSLQLELLFNQIIPGNRHMSEMTLL